MIEEVWDLIKDSNECVTYTFSMIVMGVDSNRSVRDYLRGIICVDVGGVSVGSF